MAYPVADVVLLTATVQLLATQRAWRTWIGLFAVGVASLAVADSGYAYTVADGSYRTGSPIDLGWILGFAMVAVAAAATRVPQREVVADHSLLGRRMVLLPYVVISVAGALQVAQVVAGRRVDSTQVALLVIAATLVLARQWLAVRDNQELVRIVATREAQLTHQAFHDDLTGLPNRAHFNRCVEQALRRRAPGDPDLAVVFCDLDDFKTVNDTLGHRTGDELLIDVAKRLRTVLAEGDTLARLGGDEFAVLLETGADPGAFGQRVVDVLRQPFVVGGRQIAVRASVGVAAEGGSEPATVAGLLANADLAMYSTKQSGKGAAAVYRPSMHKALVDDLTMRYALAETLDDGDIQVEYQPVVHPVSGAVVGLEALARWRRDGSNVSPELFVNLAERMGVVSQLTDLMLSKAATQLAEWSAMLGHHRLQVAVNVSALELSDPTLPSRVASVLSRHAIRSDQVVLEVTESAVMQQPEAVGRVGAELRALGVHLSLDDFGAGQSSLGRLHALPFDVIKLDRAMVAVIEQHEAPARIIAAVLGLAADLGMDAVAEGVESATQLDILRATGKPFYVQGYHLSRPLPARLLTSVLLGGIPAARAGSGHLAPSAV
jgi:diguanylate cyclase (GGDEF)-like protein